MIRKIKKIVLSVEIAVTRVQRPATVKRADTTHALRAANCSGSVFTGIKKQQPTIGYNTSNSIETTPLNFTFHFPRRAQ
jgi:hypothetical protein